MFYRKNDKKINNKNSKSSFDLSVFKLDNRGESLAIVLIGILMVGILGTMILTMTATNYKANVVDSKNQEVFYTNEKMVDEVQSYFGAEALDTANEVYTYIMKNYVVTDTSSSTTSSLTSDQATEMFRKYYFNGYDDLVIPTNSIRGVSEKFTSTAVISASTENIINTIYDYYDTNGIYTKVMDGSDVKGMKCGDFLVTLKEGTDCRVVYSDSDSDGENDTISIKNLVIGCEGDNGYYTSIKNDYVISSPNSIISFNDTKMPDNFNNLFKYAMLVEGDHSTSTVNGEGALVVNKNLTLDGNIYVGSDLDNGAKNSVVVNSGALLKAESNIFYAAGPVVVKGSQSSKGNLNLAGKGTKTLKFWAKNLTTEDSGTVTSLDSFNGAYIKINGNMLISDDLEVNGTNSEIDLDGAYFGYGFRNARRGSAIEAYANILDGFTTASSTYIQDHEKRSAMVVNGSGVNADFTGLNKLIIGGRSFVDLQDGGLSNEATYMTGESVSFKGDQKLYYPAADNTNLPEFLGGRYTISLEDVTVLATAAGESVNSFIASRMNNGSKNLDAAGNSRYNSSYPQVLYRLYHNLSDGTKDMIYFFVYDTNPRTQTNYFYNSYTGGENATVLSEINNLKVKKFQFDLGSTNIYTVGTLFSFDGANLTAATYNGDQNSISSNHPTANTITPNDFVKTDVEIFARQSLMVPSLTDVEDEIGTIATGTLVSSSSSVVRKDVYSNFIGTFDNNSKLLSAETDVTQSDLDTEVGGSFDIAKTGYVIRNINSTTDLSTIISTMKNGVVVVNITSSTAKLNIDTDFTGTIIVNGNAVISGESKLTSNENLVKYVFAHSTVNDGTNDISLGEYLLSGYIATGGARSTVDPVKNAVTYTDLVKVENYEQTNE